jgi:hypothetical protein
MRAIGLPFRVACAIVLALLLGVYSLAPTGFMPAFDHGSITIVACPDAAHFVGMQMDRHGDHKSVHQSCPYAAASALGAMPPQWTDIPEFLFFAVSLVLGRAFLFVQRQASRERPPLRGPPLRD